MHTSLRKPGIALAAATLMVGVLFSGTALAIAPIKSDLSGGQEVPPVVSTAKGTSTIVFGDDKSVSGTIKTSGMKGTAAHIHEGAKGKNGPHIIDLVMSSPDEWAVPAGAMLTGWPEDRFVPNTSVGAIVPEVAIEPWETVRPTATVPSWQLKHASELAAGDGSTVACKSAAGELALLYIVKPPPELV